MDSKAWYKSKTIAAAVAAGAAALVPLATAVGSWIDGGHSISQAISVLWPAVTIFASALAAIFRAGANTTIK